MQTKYKQITLGLTLLLGSLCNANRIELYKSMRMSEETNEWQQNLPASIRRCKWAIRHYSQGLTVALEDRASKGYIEDFRPFSDEELNGFIEIEQKILQKLKTQVTARTPR